MPQQRRATWRFLSCCLRTGQTRARSPCIGSLAKTSDLRMSLRKGPFLSCCKNMPKFRRAPRGQKSVLHLKYGLQNPTQILRNDSPIFEISFGQVPVSKNPYNMILRTRYRDKKCCQTLFDRNCILNLECDTFLASWRNLRPILLTLLRWCLCFIHSFKQFNKHYLGW